MNPSILIVEDDPVTTAMLRSMLVARGYKVTATETAEDALLILTREPIPLIILDLLLPGMSGLDFCRILRGRPGGQWYYILVGTANYTHESLTEILRAGASDYMGKPYDPNVFDIRMTVAEENVRQIADRKNLHSQLEYMAKHDPLTGLLNRSGVDDALKKALKAVKQGDTASLLYLDLDHFKSINDNLGHAVGDEVLIKVAQMLQANTRQQDRVFRFGGDEFVVILHYACLDECIRVAERLKNAAATLIEHQKLDKYSLGASIGLTRIEEGDTVTEVLARADVACYAAKQAGRNQVKIYSQSLEG